MSKQYDSKDDNNVFLVHGSHSIDRNTNQE
jgi:hypothetical protein